VIGRRSSANLKLRLSEHIVHVNRRVPVESVRIQAQLDQPFDRRGLLRVVLALPRVALHEGVGAEHHQIADVDVRPDPASPSERVRDLPHLGDDVTRVLRRHDAECTPRATPRASCPSDPAVGTGSFLFRVIDRIATTVAQDLGPGAVGPALRQAARRLIGFELQAGPYSVAELRLSTEFSRLGAHLGKDELRLHLTNTLGDPYVEEQQVPATYRPIAESRRRANAVKRSEPVVVVLGDPPYEVSGLRVVKRWFDRRKREPEGRRSSPLDDVVATSWEPEWTAELIDLLNVLTLLVELEPAQAALLDVVLQGPMITSHKLRADGVLPSAAVAVVKDRPAPERPARQTQL
jgi:hypothetical protein